MVQNKPPQTDTVAASWLPVAPIDGIWYSIEKELYHNYATAMFVLPATKTDPILLRANPEKETLYKTDFRYFNQHTGQEIAGAFVWGNYKDAVTAADHIKRLNYDVHTGAIFGLPGRFAMFFAVQKTDCIHLKLIELQHQCNTSYNCCTCIVITRYPSYLLLQMNNASIRRIHCRKCSSFFFTHRFPERDLLFRTTVKAGRVIYRFFKRDVSQVTNFFRLSSE
jgi:hypothetical protein